MKKTEGYFQQSNGQLTLFQPDFIRDADCTKETPVIYGKSDIPIYGMGKRIRPRVSGRKDTEYMKKIYLEELLPLEMYDLVIVLISGGKDSIACYYKLLELGVPKSKIEFWHHDIDGGHPSRTMDWRWEKDVWKLENFGFEVRQNPIDVIRTIKFTGIIQETIREEVKRASYIRIKYLSVGSLQGEIRAVRRFSEFLAKRNPEIKSLGEVGRLNIEEYLTYINLERGQERNLKTEMANLKNMLQQVGKVIDKPKLGKLFIKQDMPKAPEVAFKIYSDEEIKRLNYYIVNMEEQVARALILHQMLGGRISDTLTLRTDCLYQENGHYIVRMYQVKTSYYEKPIPDDVAKLIQKSMEYTYERYGETEYVFVNESNPSLPFQYSMLKHRVYTLIHENDICKDNGERMGFATHLFRHCYGMKLVELHLDDAAIAHLLGHRGVNTVYRYRRASGKLLVKETEELRKTMDEILSEIIKEWDGYEQVFQNG